MGYTKNLSGSYRIVDRPLIEAKAARNDPRRVFYRAMLENETFEGYERDTRGILVEVPGYKKNPITGRKEILYNLQNGWIYATGGS